VTYGARGYRIFGRSRLKDGPHGPGDLVFADGVAETASEAVRDAYVAAGFGYETPSELGADPAPRGSCRDAATDPRPEDYRAPVDGVAPGIGR
jgi:hypothetical protein